MLELVGIAEIRGQLSPAIQQRLDVARPVIDSYANAWASFLKGTSAIGW